jgi:hypothetical protein
MIRGKKDNGFSVEFGWQRPPRPIGSKPNPGRPGGKIPKPKPMPSNSFKPEIPSRTDRPNKNFTTMAKRMNDPNGFYYN